MRSGTVARVTLFLLAGLAAGVLTWLVSDGSGIIHLSDSTSVLTSRENIEYQVIFLTWGGSIGVMLGLADILASGQTSTWPSVVGIGLAVGMAAGVLGGALGMMLFGPLYISHAASPFDFLRNVFARAIGWAFIGALAGTASGWRKLSLRVGRNGFFGGLFGGLIGGTTFEIMPYLMPGITPGAASRAMAFLITGALIGLFVALVQELFKEAWVRVVVGKNEGKEILIEKAETRIGRAELSEIALFGDPNIARVHALLVAQPRGGFIVRDVSSSPLGVRVNDQPIQGEQPLRSGDRIQIGNRLLVFYEKFTRARTVPVNRDTGRPSAAPPPPSLNNGLSVNMGGGSIAPPGAGSIGMRTGGTPLPVPPVRKAAPGREITAEAHLVATSGPYTGTVFPIRNGAIVGRDAGAEIPLPADTKTSRNHARLVYENGSFVIEDNGSTNGIYVNGQRVNRQSLVQGDTIIIGTSAFRYE